MLVRLAALVAVDAPPASYLLNLGAAGDVGVTSDQVIGVLAAVAPIVGTTRVVAGGGKHGQGTRRRGRARRARRIRGRGLSTGSQARPPVAGDHVSAEMARRAVRRHRDRRRTASARCPRGSRSPRFGNASRCRSAIATGMYGSCAPHTTSAGRSSGASASHALRPTAPGSSVARYRLSTARVVPASMLSYIRSTNARGRPRGFPWRSAIRSPERVVVVWNASPATGRAPDLRQVVPR